MLDKNCLTGNFAEPSSNLPNLSFKSLYHKRPLSVLSLGNILANNRKLRFRKHEKSTVSNISNFEFFKFNDTIRKSL